VLAKKLKEHPSNVVFNEMRGAIQLLGCNGDVVAQFPWTDGSVAD